MVKSKYDLIVAGAGPAGLMAAKTAAEEGLSVLVIDMKRDIPKIDRSCCTMLINEPNTHGDTCKIVNNNIQYEKLGLEVEYKGMWAKHAQSIRITPGGKKLVIGNDEGVSISYNKEVLLDGLLTQCVKKGVDVLPETFVLRAENIKKNEVRVLIRGCRSRSIKDIRAKTVIAADGVNSQIVMGLELFKKRKYFVTFHVASYFLHNTKIPFEPSWITFIGKGHTPEGGGQIYLLYKYLKDAKPGDEPVVDLMFASTIGGSTKRRLDRFMKKGPFNHWFEGAEVVHTAAATLNFYSCLVPPVEGNIVAVGDSASFIETYCQGAMMYGYKAGKVVAKHLATGCGYDEYSKFWYDTFEYCWPGEIEKALKGYAIGILDTDELDYLFSLTDNEVYEGYVSENSAPEVMKKALMSKIDRIKKERPAVAEKLLNYYGKASLDEVMK